MKRKCAQTPLCSNCSSQDETTFHLLFDCEKTREVWNELLPFITPQTAQQDISEWLHTMVVNGQQERCIKAALCCWVIWKSRNEWCFQNICPTVQGMKIILFAEINGWERSREHESSRSEEVRNIDGELSNQTHIDQVLRNPKWRFLCDGSYKGEIQEAGVGIISVNPEGYIVDGVAYRFLCRDSIVAEAYPVLTACKMAIAEGGEADILSDCSFVVRACQSENGACPWECEAVVEEIRELLRNCPSVAVVKCNRKTVALADRVAKQMREGRLEANWISRLNGHRLD